MDAGKSKKDEQDVSKNLYDKVWDAHVAHMMSNGQAQLLIGLHLIHEVTSPQAFGMLRDLKLKVAYPHRTFATIDHIIPTDTRRQPFADQLAQGMSDALTNACKEFGITFFNVESGQQGIIHVVGPEQGLTQPGMTIACGDSHTATHGAFGAVAFGIGTSQVRDVLATQTISLAKLKVRRINIVGTLLPGVYAKDVILHIIRKLGVNGGTGYAYEYGGSVIDALDMDGRMTICNMSIEGGARVGYINPDEKTFAYLKGRKYAPQGAAWGVAIKRWQAVTSDANARYDDCVDIDAKQIRPIVTWGINPGQAITIDEKIPMLEDGQDVTERTAIAEALAYMKLKGGAPIKGTRINVAFIGSCTNGRISDLREVARYIEGRHVASNVRALVVPGSMPVQQQAVEEGLDRIFKAAGFQWREAGCSMCLAMNPDKLKDDELCAASSNRNFKGRMGSPTGRAMLMSPLMVAAAAIKGHIADAREVFQLNGQY
ncbi:MAG: 3-isopropylmalate dehydratase large subunit [Planctomycetota bacterium]